MRTIQKRALKGQLLDYYQKKGIQVDCTDTPNLVLFSQQKLTDKSFICDKTSTGLWYMTSFGVVAAQKLTSKTM